MNRITGTILISVATLSLVALEFLHLYTSLPVWLVILAIFELALGLLFLFKRDSGPA